MTESPGFSCSHKELEENLVTENFYTVFDNKTVDY